MTILEEWKEKLISDKSIHVFYRVEGGMSYENFTLKKDQIMYDTNGRYVYFSANEKHHKYYLSKRVNQLALRNDDENQKRDYLSTNSLYIYRNNLPRIQKSFKTISPNKINIKCLSFYFLEDTFKLIKENSRYYSNKKMKNIPERVDIKVSGGGYGMNEDWLRLFYLSTFMTEVTPVTKEDIEKYLSKLTYLLGNEINICNEQKTRCFLSDSLHSSFTKYELIDTLENILSEKKYSPTSSLGKEPKKTVKKLVKSYELTREYSKQLLDQKLGQKYAVS